MPGLVPGINVFMAEQDVDSRDEPAMTIVVGAPKKTGR